MRKPNACSLRPASCEWSSQASTPCAGEVGRVTIQTGKTAAPPNPPRQVLLCENHKLELWTGRANREIEGCANREDFPVPMTEAEEGPQDSHLTYLAPDVLEGVANAGIQSGHPWGYEAGGGYEYLRGAHLVLEEVALTDKQLTAVSLVFYGGVTKKRAAQAMKISSQALSGHIKAALKKIESAIR